MRRYSGHENNLRVGVPACMVHNPGTAVCKLVVIVNGYQVWLIATPDNIVHYREALYNCYHIG